MTSHHSCSLSRIRSSRCFRSLCVGIYRLIVSSIKVLYNMDKSQIELAFIFVWTAV